MFAQGYMGQMGSMGYFPLMGFVFWIVFAIVIFLLVNYFRRDDTHVRRTSSALEILEERLVKGEISKEEFLDIKKTLR